MDASGILPVLLFCENEKGELFHKRGTAPISLFTCVFFLRGRITVRSLRQQHRSYAG